MSIAVFGEVLFDCFPDGKKIPGGAPFNVAWHLQAFGNAPCFISRIGTDSEGRSILRIMDNWGLDTTCVQDDDGHPTGRVEVRFHQGEPHYDIVTDSAYDFIATEQLPRLADIDILYHGTLALRNSVSRKTLDFLTQGKQPRIFLDVNLRSPWWQSEHVLKRIEKATWVKMNREELHLLGYDSGDIKADMTQLCEQFQLDQLIVTQGAHGASVLSADGELQQRKPTGSARVVDTVGAGDAFCAVYLHGLARGWPVAEILCQAQSFADKIVGLRGATTEDRDIYRKVNAR
ncbi:MAG: carbohydrate kinase [Desulfuromonas sp.]|nr:MAG: carbohydrate kinase [Desulfuromonas sp.]